MTGTLVAYHGDKALKTRTLRKVAAHRRADRIIQGAYWREDEDGVFKGCAVGCLLNDPEGGHERYETEFGIPELLAHLEDGIFEALPADKAAEWPGRFLGAIRVGADLTTVWPRFAIWLMVDPDFGLVNASDEEDVKDVCRKVAAGYEQILAGGISEADAKIITDAARAAWGARASRAAWGAWDAWDARGAWGAWAARAARGARAAWAARAARGAWDAWDARDAWGAWAAWGAWGARGARASRASRAAWDARASRAAWDARDAFVAASSEKLIELLKAA